MSYHGLLLRAAKGIFIEYNVLFINSKLATVSRDWSADVSGVSPTSERIKVLWVVCVYIVSNGATLLVGTW